MKLVELIRIETSSAEKSDQTRATLGVLRIDSEMFCVTLEPPTRSNIEGGDSCIPAGEYTCKRYSSKKHPDTFTVSNVPNRTNVLIHAGNTDLDTEGCIVLGKYSGRLFGSRAVLDSRLMFKMFMEKMANEKEFMLRITEV